MSIREDRSADIANTYAATLRALSIPSVAVWVDLSPSPTAFAVRIGLDAKAPSKKAREAFQGIPAADAAGHCVDDMIIHLCEQFAGYAAKASGAQGVVIAALDDKGRLHVDHPATATRVSGGTGPDHPAPYGVLDFNAPELFVDDFDSMRNTLLSQGVSHILIDVREGTVSYRGADEAREGQARSATDHLRETARAFAIQMITSARAICGTGVVPHAYDDCKIRFEIESGTTVLSSGDSDEGYEIPSMSTALDPAGLPPEAKLYADIGHTAIVARDLAAYEQASQEFSRATGLQPQSLVRYATWVQLSDAPRAN